MIKLLNTLFFFLRDYLAELSEKENYKRCFTCKRVKKLKEFEKENSKYQRKEWKGRRINCKECQKEYDQKNKH